MLGPGLSKLTSLTTVGGIAPTTPAGGGAVVWIEASSTGSARRFLQIYNASSSAVTVGTTNPIMSLDITITTTLAVVAKGKFDCPNGVAYSQLAAAGTTTATGATMVTDTIVVNCVVI